MSRTNAAYVKTILRDGNQGSDYDGTTDLTPYIDWASAITDDVSTCATAKGVTISASRLELIEAWLAAHAYATSDKPYASTNTNKAGASFHGMTKMYLEATLYGQQARSLDSSGCLAAIAGEERKSAGGFWLGKPPSSQIDYEDRN